MLASQRQQVAPLTYAEIVEARQRIEGHVRRVTVAPMDVGAVPTAARDPLDDREPVPCRVWLALEHMQFTGSFKARGAWNFLAAHLVRGAVPDVGITIASGGNAGLACAWAAQRQGVPATVFVPQTAPAVKVEALRGYGADVRLIGSEYAEALAACESFAKDTGALASHAYDDRLIAAGAGTLLAEIREQIPGLDTVVVSVGGGGLFAGIATAAQHEGVRTIAVEPETCRALNAALEVGHVVDVPVQSIAADSLGARRASEIALVAAQHPSVQSLLVTDEAIISVRRRLWSEYHLLVEHAAAASLAALTAPPVQSGPSAVASSPGSRRSANYTPVNGERIAVVMCGANTEP